MLYHNLSIFALISVTASACASDTQNLIQTYLEKRYTNEDLQKKWNSIPESKLELRLAAPAHQH